MIKNKKAQAYPIFVVIFTVAALTFLYIEISDMTEIKNVDGSMKLLGDSQSSLFSTIQKGHAINLYLEKSAELAASESLSEMQKSCLLEYNVEAVSDPLESSCGKYIYPLWSTKEYLCLPRCKDSFIDSFNLELAKKTKLLSDSTGIKLPEFYELEFETFDEYSLIHGKSSVKSNYRILSSSEIQLSENLKQETTEQIEEKPLVEEKIIEAKKIESELDNYGLLSWPVNNPDKTLVSCFGARITDGSLNHPAVDMRANLGDEVFAAAPGKVVFTDSNCWGRIIIDHGKGLKTEYLHLDKIFVKNGDDVKRGEKIGAAGGAGKIKGVCSKRAYNPHLHFGVIYSEADINSLIISYC
jgi:murein DD-endopeptidase MepM/ murein hydrolase activator NlpD